MGLSTTVLEIGANELSAKGAALVSEFALILYRSTGTLIDVHSDDAIYRVIQNATKVSDSRLHEICLHVKAELSNALVSTQK